MKQFKYFCATAMLYANSNANAKKPILNVLRNTRVKDTFISITFKYVNFGFRRTSKILLLRNVAFEKKREIFDTCLGVNLN